jgi:hypothetical protein
MQCVDAAVYFRLTLALQNIDLSVHFETDQKTEIKKQVTNERNKEKKKELK